MAVPLAHDQLTGRLSESLLYKTGTIILLVSGIVVVACWPQPASSKASAPRQHHSVGRTRGDRGIRCGVLTALQLLPTVFAGPVDVNRADMLVIIEEGVRRFLAGKTPYAMFHVPWLTTLSYGPTLWMPYVIPITAHADPRILTLVAQLMVIVTCICAAALSASTRHWAASASLVVLGMFVALHPYIRSFHAIGHTQVYWPLIIVFALLLRFDQWTGAAAALGLLVSARTTMASLVPCC